LLLLKLPVLVSLPLLLRRLLRMGRHLRGRLLLGRRLLGRGLLGRGHYLLRRRCDKSEPDALRLALVPID
jgi:hypothetical protein